MNKLLIITGGGRGLGKAVIDVFLEFSDFTILSLSRRIDAEHQGNERVHLYNCDLANFDITPFKVYFITEFSKYDQFVFVNNAFTIFPIERVENLHKYKIEDSININLISSIKLISFLIDTLKGKKIDIINITSGAANKAIDSWGMYCASKSFIEMILNVLKLETDSTNTQIFNFEPGVIDTDMQKSIRESNCKDKEIFNGYKNNDKLNSAKNVALKLFKLIIES